MKLAKPHVDVAVMSNRLDPMLTAEFDVESALPWDTALHEFVETSSDPLMLLDYESIHPTIVDQYRMLTPSADL